MHALLKFISVFIYFGLGFNSVFAQTWTLTSAPSYSWNSIACSADGTRLVAVADNGPIYGSVDSGDIWTPTAAPSNDWAAVACSADGTRIVAAAGHHSSGAIWTSADAGLNW